MSELPKRVWIRVTFNNRELANEAHAEQYVIKKLRQHRVPIESEGTPTLVAGIITRKEQVVPNLTEFVWSGLESEMLPPQPNCSCEGLNFVGCPAHDPDLKRERS